MGISATTEYNFFNFVPNGLFEQMDECPDHRKWMYNRVLDNGGGYTDEFLIGVESFISFAKQQLSYQKNGVIRCPCKKHKSLRFYSVDEVKICLYKRGFMDKYWYWTAHGESYPETIECERFNCGGSISGTEHVLKNASFSIFYLSFEESFSKGKERLLAAQALPEVSSPDYDIANSIPSYPPALPKVSSSNSDTANSIPSDPQLWRQVVGERKVYGMRSQAQAPTMCSGVYHTEGHLSQRMCKIVKMMETILQSTLYLMHRRGIQQPLHMQQPPMPYAPWMPPLMPFPPTSQMNSPHYYPWTQPPPKQQLTPIYPWMQSPCPSVWPHCPGAPSQAPTQTQAQAQIPTNQDVAKERGSKKEEEDLQIFP